MSSLINSTFETSMTIAVDTAALPLIETPRVPLSN